MVGCLLSRIQCLIWSSFLSQLPTVAKFVNKMLDAEESVSPETVSTIHTHTHTHTVMSIPCEIT